ncbi:MAG: L,D-transpeptidase family protein [Rhodoplanes sp.]|uniref:L,D-transpeptidase family protein n=1 Tax=Rhodoplanes sp. TaxID=1968906 RepID=UPI0017C925FB|nr:L,D-transpeptidase family protein [Rhodoplanes sp.]NVO15199.1 L,D-transpeptidase family protein [Rhodoplanes sp.]
MRFDRLLAGTALALVLAIGTAQAQSVPSQPAPDTSSLDTAVPATEPAPLVVTPTDIAPAAAETKSETKADAAPSAPAAPPTAVTESNPDRSPEPAATPAETAAVPPTPAATTVVTPADTAPPKAAAAPAGEPAATGSIPVVPLAKVVTVDQQVGEKLADLIGRKTDRRFDAKVRTSLETFYGGRSYAPVWTDNGAVNERGRAVTAQLRAVADDGLDPDDYAVPQLKADASPDEIADFELKLDATLLAYARHAAVGRVHWSRVSGDIVYYQTAPEAAEVLGKLASASDARAALDSYMPQHPAYKALKAKLAEVRGLSGEGAAKRIGYGPALKVGMEDERVPDLREKLGVAGTGTTYDKPLGDAVKALQKQKGLKQTGTFDTATIDAMNGPRNERTADIIAANLERWRWVAHDLGKSHVVVNIPEYMLRVYNNGATVWTTRVVVGKPGNHATPLLSETMKYITVNPTWNVPPSIVYGEYLPALQQDPTVLSRMGLNVSRNPDGSVHISQPPGAGNALGRIRFNFPNKFLVYQHDTPDKHLFAHDKRAYSHGCMRVKDPDKYAEVLLGLTLPHERYTAERIRAMYGSGERDIRFPNPIPVHLTYQTASVDETGKLVIREDIYGRDSRTIAALKSDERKYAETPVEPRREASSAGAVRRQAVRLPQEQPRSSGFPLFNLFR